MNYGKNMERLNIHNIIPVDEDYVRRLNDDESSDDGASAWSVASSVHNFKVENGRRYHDYKDGHPFPHDEVSQENEVCFNTVCLLLFNNKYFSSPIQESELHCVADVGTGMGLWAEGMAERYPHAEVVGMDITAHERSTYPNCSFIVLEATEEWVLDDPQQKFDLVHIRNLSIGVRDYQALYKNAFE
jgi:2-polyprenyl-3-methyl-5-hydroxy-6-metoxy-1,4-benzoquinol methylase